LGQLNGTASVNAYRVALRSQQSDEDALLADIAESITCGASSQERPADFFTDPSLTAPIARYRNRWDSSEVDSGSHRDQSWRILRRSSASEIWVSDCSINPEVCPVEGVERIGADLKPDAVAVRPWPKNKLLDEGRYCR
jgi:hypothetical protein